MSPFWLHVQAPFGAFRWLQAGVYRASSPTIPPSAAWGLVLNLAGIETRDSAPIPVTRRKVDVPRIELAIGELRPPQVNSVYQQLHGYPVGNSGKDLAAVSHGSKYWIVPVRREILTDIDLFIGVRGADAILERQLKAGLDGAGIRYGLPFLGDNNFLVDRIDLLDHPGLANWFCRLDHKNSDSVRDTCRLTVDIDREDSALTRAAIYRRSDTPTDVPPESAWTWVPGAPD